MSSTSLAGLAAAAKFAAIERNPVPQASEKGSRQVKGQQRRLTVSQVTALHPVVDRYVQFARTMLKLYQRADASKLVYSKPTADNAAAVALGFYQSECANSASGQAIPTSRSVKVESKQARTRTAAEPAGKKKKVDKTTAELAQNLKKFMPSHFLIPSVRDTESDTNVEVHKDCSSNREKLRHRELTHALEQCSKKDIKVLEHLADDFKETKNALSDPAIAQVAQERLNLFPEKDATQDQKDRNSVVYEEEFLALKPRWLRDRVQRMDVRLAAGLPLVPLDQIQASLRVWLTLAEKIPSFKAEEKDLSVLSQKGQVPLAGVKEAVKTIHWGKTRNLGRCHPRLLLTMWARNYDDPIDAGLLERFKAPFFEPLFPKRKQKPANPPSTTDDSPGAEEEEFPPLSATRRTGLVERKDPKRPGKKS